ncbi:hypothetical protein, partial [Sporichthya sp.]|uniref:hypothetical protein n=1 Tax=Sporichthya sp. TaxID=65475 RepID=UPI00184BADBA
ASGGDSGSGDAAATTGSTATTSPTTGSAPGDDGPDRGERVRHMVVNGEPLSDEQGTCMEENAPPPPFAQGERPTREDMGDHHEQVEAAMDECGIEHPEPGEGEERGFACRVERGGPEGGPEKFGRTEGGRSGSGELRVTEPDGAEYGFSDSAPSEAAPANA